MDSLISITIENYSKGIQLKGIIIIKNITLKDDLLTYWLTQKDK